MPRTIGAFAAKRQATRGPLAHAALPEDRCGEDAFVVYDVACPGGPVRLRHGRVSQNALAAKSMGFGNGAPTPAPQAHPL